MHECQVGAVGDREGGKVGRDQGRERGKGHLLT